MTVQTVNGSLDGAAEITSYRGYNATVRVVVSRDGYVKSYAINFDLDVTANVTVLFFKTSTTLTANIDAELTYNERQSGDDHFPTDTRFSRNEMKKSHPQAALDKVKDIFLTVFLRVVKLSREKGCP
jgi:hypothetical protein